MTIQQSISDPRSSSSRENEKPVLANRKAFLESGEGSDHHDVVAGGSVTSELTDDDDSLSFYEEEDLSDEEKEDEKCDHDEDEVEQSFSYLYGHMSASSASMTDGEISLDDIREDEEVATEFGIMNEKKKAQEGDTDYGYGDAMPDSAKQIVDYGYGDAIPDSDRRRQQPTSRSKFVRRSSLKQMNGSSHSRASLCVGDEIEVQLPCQEKTIKRRRSINFIEKVDVKHVEKVTEMDGKKEELWFQAQEFKDIAMEVYRDANKVKKGCKTIDTRGLENILDEDRMEKRVDTAIDMVMDAQDIQYDNCAFDESQISDLYILSAVDSKIDARVRARRDAREVEEYLRETRRAMRRMSM
ncbi:unnamed protein product [Cylindrotheca closterium]|uniref:Uncharacterized protein n=1 Tax=Cylindrotheca closterium TaxID=2856 RepID=A0AAD2PWE4_9STRA|nr:unnamed protein product [Cylindrotheca closterium]